MKSFFARRGLKIGGFSWAWCFLGFLLAVILLIVLFYREEDRWGAHEWSVARSRWETDGKTLDLQKMVPAAFPAKENLGAIPLFRLTVSGPEKGEPTALETAMRKDEPGGIIPRISTLALFGRPPDVAKIKIAVADEFREAFPKQPIPADALDQLDTIFPFLRGLLAASATRPLCGLPGDYSVSPPAARPLGGIVVQIKVTKLLTLQAILALDDHQPAVALADIETIYKLISGVQRDPTLIAGLVAIGMAAISNEAIVDGLMNHAWNDAQLMELEQTLASVDFLASYGVALRGEASYFAGNMEVFQRNQKRSIFRSFLQQLNSAQLPVLTRFAPPWPDGWWDENISLEADFLFEQLTVIDPDRHRVYPLRSNELQRQEEAVNRWDATAPWRIFFTEAVKPLQCASKFAFAQVHLDEARVGCALERYHLAHEAYPSELDALVPGSMSELPRDPVNGEPYRYRFCPDGTYFLYSIGWDLKDDGGTVVYRSDESRAIDEKQGDWVWPTPK